MDQNNIQDERYLRWTKNERIQHWILAGSFIVLGITGFALKYPAAWWVRPFIGSDFVFNVRGLLHRIAGSTFIGLGIYHIGYLAFTKRGRSQLKALTPQVQDIRDGVQNFAFNLGLSKRKPRFGHYSYIEKVEYWALIWGAVIMGGTGLMLWFNELTLTVLPKWALDLLTVIHLYEAWLATLAIVVWHFYMVLFKPDIYPIDLSMITGEISGEMLRDEHFLEYKQMQESSREVPQEESISSSPKS